MAGRGLKNVGFLDMTTKTEMRIERTDHEAHFVEHCYSTLDESKGVEKASYRFLDNLDKSGLLKELYP